MYEQSRSCRRRRKDAPDVVRYLNNLAVLHHATGAHDKAEPLMARAAEIRESQLQLELARLSARASAPGDALAARDREPGVAARRFHAGQLSSVRACVDHGLAPQGLASSHCSPTRRPARSHHPGIRSQLDGRGDEQRSLDALARAGRAETAASRAATIASLRTRIDAVESDLNAASAALRAGRNPLRLRGFRQRWPNAPA